MTTDTASPTDRMATLQHLTEQINQKLKTHLPSENTTPTQLHQAMRYAVLSGGKRLRPLLVHATADALGYRGHKVDAPACAVEYIHAYSLIHDDLPAMDNDTLRRGQPTCHVAFGEALAILAGDALQAHAFTTLAHDKHNTAKTRANMLETLSHACGSAGMAGGQVLDINATGQLLDQASLEQMHNKKTGALITAAVAMGALAAGCEDTEIRNKLAFYSSKLGLAFQVRDDILDIESETDTLGKTVGKDQAQTKATFPSILGLEASKQYLNELTEEALDAIHSLGKSASLLVQLAQFAAVRSY